MLFAKLAMDRALAEKKDTEDPQRMATGGAATDAGRGGCWGSPRKDRLAARTPSSRRPLVTDSEWLDLSAEEQLAWAQNTQDPRIAVGSQSPLEKKIKSLGDVHSSKVRKFLLQKSQQENETLHQLKAMSFDFRFAKAEAYYYQRHQEMMLGEAWRYTMVPRWEIKIERERPQSEKTGDAKKWDYLVPERELDHIEKHIYRAERARGLRDHKYQLLPQRIPSETVFPKILTLRKEEKTETIQKTHKAKTKKHRAAWAKEQIKGHQDRMIRGRELTEQRSERLRAWKMSSPAPPLHRPATHKEEEKEFEQITAYPIAQPYQEALIEVTIRMEKSRKEDNVKKPLRRELLSMPPFLRSQLEKNKI
ncbi:uncharacterized protein LOC113252015 [Ursus arctos]|uniref:uncharacterized protein LOC113252015 n=1 Tax=Ursus arctos TaxID=9644 RepID=UPI002546E418|nr:uncharacterized protein LOC113252015 [Ursus arctos]XP_057164611.1 uncharacterized protein LOC113252015 [Ursus arctos]XP_057164612.1 uncharacterized protein LOC113252015 [Ursus arctos]